MKRQLIEAVPLDPFGYVGLTAEVYDTPRPFGRRIIVKDSDRKVRFDTQDCFDYGNASSSFNHWLTTEGRSC